jgi:hypothetical protein
VRISSSNYVLDSIESVSLISGQDHPDGEGDDAYQLLRSLRRYGCFQAVLSQGLVDGPLQSCCTGLETDDVITNFTLGLARGLVVTLGLDAHNLYNDTHFEAFPAVRGRRSASSGFRGRGLRVRAGEIHGH